MSDLYYVENKQAEGRGGIQQKLPRRRSGSSLLYHGRAKAARFHFPAPCLCVIAQHKIRLQKRNWLALAGSKHRSSPTTLSVFLSGVCWILKEVALHLRMNLAARSNPELDSMVPSSSGYSISYNSTSNTNHWHLRSQPSISPTTETPWAFPSPRFLLCLISHSSPSFCNSQYLLSPTAALE